jgi:hypothetical protein
VSRYALFCSRRPVGGTRTGSEARLANRAAHKGGGYRRVPSWPLPKLCLGSSWAGKLYFPAEEATELPDKVRSQTEFGNEKNGDRAQLLQRCGRFHEKRLLHSHRLAYFGERRIRRGDVDRRGIDRDNGVTAGFLVIGEGNDLSELMA